MLEFFGKYNYGQFFTLWDHIGGSFRVPSAFEGNALLKEVDTLSSDNEKLKAWLLLALFVCQVIVIDSVAAF